MVMKKISVIWDTNARADFRAAITYKKDISSERRKNAPGNFGLNEKIN
jgi:hypothetical protein